MKTLFKILGYLIYIPACLLFIFELYMLLIIVFIC